MGFPISGIKDPAQSARDAVTALPDQGQISANDVRDMIVHGTEDLDDAAATSEHDVLKDAYDKLDRDGRLDDRGRELFSIYDGYAAKARDQGHTGIPMSDYNAMKAKMDKALSAPQAKPYTLEGGTLKIQGTESSDKGSLARHGDHYDLEMNGARHQIPAKDVRNISVDLKGGNDTFEIGRRPTPSEMQRSAALGNRAVPSQDFAPITIDGGAGDDTIRNVSARGARIMGGSGNNNIANYADDATIIGGKGSRDTVANGGSDATIDYSNGGGFTLDQIADRANITGSPSADIMRISGNDNTIRPDLKDYVRFLPDVDGAPTTGNSFSNDGKVDALSDAATIKEAYIGALESGVKMPGTEIIPPDVAQRGLDMQRARGVIELFQALAEQYRAETDPSYATYAMHTTRALQVYAMAVRQAYGDR